MKNKVVVIGSGPGGYVAAIRAAQKGFDVTIVEKDYIGGVCLNVGCIPSKALITVAKDYSRRKQKTVYGVSSKDSTLDFSAAQSWKNDQVITPLTGGIEALLNKNKVNILRGFAEFTGKNSIRVHSDGKEQDINFDYAIIATGSQPIELNNFEFDQKNVLDSTGLLNIDKVPENLAVVGGGYIGTELANLYSNLGSKVTIIEGLSSILSNFDSDISKLVENDLKKQGISIKTNCMVQEYKTKKSGLEIIVNNNGKNEIVKTDKILVSVGRRPNTKNMGLEKIGIELEKSGHVKVDANLRSSVKNIYAIGDVTQGPALAHKASYEAKFVVDSISGSNYNSENVVIPSVCFTNLECASVGMNASDAKTDSSNYGEATFPFAANGMSLAQANTEGFARLIYKRSNKQIVGAQVVGNNAGELITQLTQAIANELVVEDIALTVHPHPSQSESIMDASELALGLPIHI